MGDFWNKRKRGDAMWEKVENGGEGKRDKIESSSERGRCDRTQVEKVEEEDK